MDNNNKPEMIVYGNLLENMTDGAFVLGYDGRIHMENSVAAELTGMKEDGLQGKRLMELIVEHKENDAFFECIIHAVYEKAKMSQIVPYYTQEGKKYLRLVVSPIRNREEDIAAIVIISDITEIIELNNRNQELNRKLSDFIDRFVKMMVNAIDERSHYNANHTRNMVRYAEKYLDYLDGQGRGISKRHRVAFLTSVWMHDIGKLVTPLRILDKPTRLGEKEKEVFGRLEVAVLCERIRVLEAGSKTDASKKGAAVIDKLMEAKQLIREVNVKGYVDGETRRRIEALADIQCLTPTGESVPLLSAYELNALTVEHGTLTEEERQIVQSHVTHTYDMLKQMQFGGWFKDVPEWSGKHHEYLDGSGYPNGITGEQITWETRLLTILDIYDALTAEDRPYKPPMPEQKAFEVLWSMCDEGKLDRDILKDFHASGAWNKEQGHGQVESETEVR